MQHCTKCLTLWYYKFFSNPLLQGCSYLFSLNAKRTRNLNWFLPLPDSQHWMMTMTMLQRWCPPRLYVACSHATPKLSLGTNSTVFAPHSTSIISAAAATIPSLGMRKKIVTNIFGQTLNGKRVWRDLCN